MSTRHLKLMLATLAAMMLMILPSSVSSAQKETKPTKAVRSVGVVEAELFNADMELSDGFVADPVEYTKKYL